jgi:hypothetical protein
MFYTNSLLFGQSFRSLVSQMNKVHKHLIVTLLAVVIYLQKSLEEFFVVGITFIDESFGHKNCFSFVYYYTILVILKQVYNKIKERLSYDIYSFYWVISLALVYILF